MPEVREALLERPVAGTDYNILDDTQDDDSSSDYRPHDDDSESESASESMYSKSLDHDFDHDDGSSRDYWVRSDADRNDNEDEGVDNATEDVVSSVAPSLQNSSTSRSPTPTVRSVHDHSSHSPTVQDHSVEDQDRRAAADDHRRSRPLPWLLTTRRLPWFITLAVITLNLIFSHNGIDGMIFRPLPRQWHHRRRVVSAPLPLIARLEAAFEPVGKAPIGLFNDTIEATNTWTRRFAPDWAPIAPPRLSYGLGWDGKVAIVTAPNQLFSHFHDAVRHICSLMSRYRAGEKVNKMMSTLSLCGKIPGILSPLLVLQFNLTMTRRNLADWPDDARYALGILERWAEKEMPPRPPIPDIGDDDIVDPQNNNAYKRRLRHQWEQWLAVDDRSRHGPDDAAVRRYLAVRIPTVLGRFEESTEKVADSIMELIQTYREVKAAVAALKHIVDNNRLDCFERVAKASRMSTVALENWDDLMLQLIDHATESLRHVQLVLSRLRGIQAWIRDGRLGTGGGPGWIGHGISLRHNGSDHTLIKYYMPGWVRIGASLTSLFARIDEPSTAWPALCYKVKNEEEMGKQALNYWYKPLDDIYHEKWSKEFDATFPPLRHPIIHTLLLWWKVYIWGF